MQNTLVHENKENKSFFKIARSILAWIVVITFYFLQLQLINILKYT